MPPSRRQVVLAWAIEAELDPGAIKSNAFDMEWPPRSGRCQAFPEIWGQIAVLDELAARAYTSRDAARVRIEPR